MSQRVIESGSQGVKESRSQGVIESTNDKVILEMFYVYPIITESSRVDRITVYDYGHKRTNRQTNIVTFVLHEVANFQSTLKNLVHQGSRQWI